MTIFFFFVSILYSSPNIFNHSNEGNSLSNFPFQNIQGQLQQQPPQQIDFIKYHYQSDFIKEFEVSGINNETGLKGITTDPENNVWFYHNTNTSSAIIEFNHINKTFTKYPISYWFALLD